jgi:hypothetical protein
VGQIGASTAVLTAMLFYFGWARTNATYRYFGVDLSLLKFSTGDYVLRSVNSVYKPLLAIGILGLAGALVIDAVASGEPGAKTAAVVIRRTATVLGAALLLTGGIGLVVAGEALAVPAALVAGVGALLYARRLAPTSASPAAGEQRARSRIDYLLVVLVVITGFWALSLYAQHVGSERARHLLADPTTMSLVVIYARDQLDLDAPGITSAGVSSPSSTYHWRYGGFRLLIHNDGKYFLLPARWKRGRDPVYVIPEQSAVRFELRVP